MKIFLDESHCREQLRPFTQTRHVADIRIGILTIREKWALLTGYEIVTTAPGTSSDCININVQFLPEADNYAQIIESAISKDSLTPPPHINILQYPWQIFQFNDRALRTDFEILTKNRQSAPIEETNHCISEQAIFIEEGAVVSHSILNASTGPIYIGKNATVMEGSMIRGPFSLGKDSVLKMGSKVYGATTIGPGCLAGGEIKNSVLFEFSNKAHDGYLGDSVIGAWCNLGAGTSNSNVKNTGGEVKFQLNETPDLISAGNKAGLLMADYSRAAINTSFNTGTVVGVCCNIFGETYPPKHIPDFTWGRNRYEFDKAIRDIDNWKKMKGQSITENETALLKKLYQHIK